MITQQRLKELVIYDPETGIFTWRNSRKGCREGSEAGCLLPSGIINIGLDGKKCKAHRMAFLYQTGDIPDIIDHANRDNADNRWCNLRSATKITNGQNSKKSKRNTTGFKGVTIKSDSRRKKRFQAKIRYNKKTICLGVYLTAEEAAEAYQSAARSYFGEFNPKTL